MQEPDPIDWDGSHIVDIYKEAYDSMYYTLTMCHLYLFFI